MPRDVGRTKHELRCVCAREPLLALYGVTESGLPYVHVKIYKQRRIYGEMFVTEGKVELRCRECFRWYTVRIVDPSRAVLKETEVPPQVANPAP
jgi:hypothetical protein